MQLHSMVVNNFRCFQDARIVFDTHLTVLTGKNGSGKSALLEAVAIFLKQISGAALHTSQVPDNTLFRFNSTSMSFQYDYTDEAKNILPYELKYSRSDKSVSQIDPKFPWKIWVNPSELPVVALYGAKRILAAYNRKINYDSSLASVFMNLFEPGIDFTSTYTWFIEKSSEEALEMQYRRDLEYRIPELSAVRSAVANALGDYSEPFVASTPPDIFIVPKNDNGRRYTLNQLSDGYRTMLALVMDLARRMAVATEASGLTAEDALSHDAIVLIDEIELHLHPAWQQTVLPTLMRIFPNTQFIVTTHSPQILSSIESRHVRILGENGQIYDAPKGIFGAEASRILNQVFGVATRSPSKATDDLDEYAQLVYTDQWDSEQAISLRSVLDKRYEGTEPKLIELDLYIENRIWEKQEEQQNETHP